MGWLGNVLIVLGIICLAHKVRAGFLLGAAGNCCWLVHGLGQPDLMAISALIVVLQSWSWWKWGRE